MATRIKKESKEYISLGGFRDYEPNPDFSLGDSVVLASVKPPNAHPVAEARRPAGQLTENSDAPVGER